MHATETIPLTQDSNIIGWMTDWEIKQNNTEYTISGSMKRPMLIGITAITGTHVITLLMKIAANTLPSQISLFFHFD